MDCSNTEATKRPSVLGCPRCNFVNAADENSFLWRKRINHLHDAHHAKILMWKNVAMIDEFSNEILEWDTDYRFTVRRNHYRVLQATGIISLYSLNLLGDFNFS